MAISLGYNLALELKSLKYVLWSEKQISSVQCHLLQNRNRLDFIFKYKYSESWYLRMKDSILRECFQNEVILHCIWNIQIFQQKQKSVAPGQTIEDLPLQ